MSSNQAIIGGLNGVSRELWSSLWPSSSTLYTTSSLCMSYIMKQKIIIVNGGWHQNLLVGATLYLALSGLSVCHLHLPDRPYGPHKDSSSSSITLRPA